MLALSRRLVSSTVSGIILVLLIILACYVSMGRILVANIDTFRAEIEARLSDTLNVDVSLEGLRGGWTYLDPEIYIDRLTIGNADDPAIQIEMLGARLDSVATVREGWIVVRELHVGGLALSLVQDADGGWYVEGLPRRGADFNVDPLLSSVAYLQEVDVTGVDVEVKARQKHYHLTNQPDRPFVLLAEGNDKLLSMPLLFQEPDKDSRGFELLGGYRGDPRKPSKFNANLYLQLPTIELADFLPPKVSSILREAQVEGEFWLDWRAGEFLFHALPQINKIRIRHGDNDVDILSQGTARLVARGNSLDNLEVYVEELSGMLGAMPWSLTGLNVAVAGNDRDSAIAAHLSSLDVEDAVRAILELSDAFGIIPATGRTTLAGIAPGGVLEDLVILREPASTIQQLKVSARLVGVHVDSREGSPSISSLNGFISGSKASGYIDVYNDAFELDYAGLFPEPWPLDSARGRIHYVISPDYVQVKSELIELAQGSLRAGGRFHVNLPDELAHRTWGLEVGIKDGELVHSTRYLPNTLSENLNEWLGRSVKGGIASTAGLLFHGPLGKQAPKAGKVYELFFDVEDATLDYEKSWPPVQDLSAMIYIGNWGVTSDNARGRIYETRIDNGRVDMTAGFDQPADSVRVHGNLSGPLTDGIRVLAETPVAGAINNIASAWQGEGNFTGAMGLNVPIGVRAGEPVGVDVNIDLAGNSIYMPDFDLDIRGVSGQVAYNNVSGLRAQALSASLFEEPVDARIETRAGSDTSIHVDGRVDVKALYDWSGQTILARAAGVTGYSARAHIPFGGTAGRSVYVAVESDLEGVSIDLPSPMNKAADGSMALAYKQTFEDPGYTIDLKLGDLTQASFRTREGVIAGGRLHFGAGAMPETSYDKLDVSGDLAFVDYDEWEAVTLFLESRSDVSISSEMANTLSAIDINVGFMKAFGLELERVATYITRSPGQWNVRLSNKLLSGLIKVPDTETLPLDIALDYLRFPDEADGNREQSADPLSSVVPTDLIAIDFTLESLEIGEENYGTWSFEMRPREIGVQLSNLTADVKGLHVVAGAEVIWNYSVQEGHLSQFVGSVNVSDLASALKQWGFASSIEGQKFHFDADFSWPGSPAAIDIDTIAGLVHLRQGRGRFVQAESAGALKLLGIFDFASLARRFRFDFTDVVNDGLEFSEIKGSTRFDEGLVTIVSPIVIVGAGSTFKVGGTVNLADSTLDNDMIVTLPVSRNLPWYAAYSAIATGPLTGAGVWLAQKIFENQINAMTSAKYNISGTIDEPVVEFVSIFDDSIRQNPEVPRAVKPEAGPRDEPDDNTERVSPPESLASP